MVLRARNPSDAFALWAEHRADLALLASRDAETTRDELRRDSLTRNDRVIRHDGADPG
jgi:hypothetical protein